MPHVRVPQALERKWTFKWIVSMYEYLHNRDEICKQFLFLLVCSIMPMESLSRSYQYLVGGKTMVSSILGITALLPFGNIIEENFIMVHYLTTYINNCILFLEAICYLVYTRMTICYLFWYIYILKCKSLYNIQNT